VEKDPVVGAAVAEALNAVTATKSSGATNFDVAMGSLTPIRPGN